MPDGNQVQIKDEAQPRQDLIRLTEPRLPWHPQLKERFGVDAASWRALIDAVWPAAKSVDAVVLALSYCKARNLDPFKRPVHIVPIYSRELNRMVESVWPGIGELRTTAFRTGLYGGRDKPEFGPDKTLDLGGVAVTFPEWCELTVYRLGRTGERLPYPGPRVYWLEAYATAKHDTVAPNQMWRKRPRGQLEKCAEAAALRAAFPEELGNEYAADEMAGQMIEHTPPPPRPQPEDYSIVAAVEEATEQTEALPRFEATDSFGEPHEYGTEMDAIEALFHWMCETRSLRALEGLAESNPALAHYPVIIEAYKDRKEALGNPNPGNRQDHPDAGAPPPNPARGATAIESPPAGSAGTAGERPAHLGSGPAATEHPEGGTASTQTERSMTEEPAHPVASPARHHDDGTAATAPKTTPNDRPRDGSLAVNMTPFTAIGGKINWDEVSKVLLKMIAGFTDPVDTDPARGRFISANRPTLDDMRRGNKDAWVTVSYELSKKHRVLMGGAP